MNILTIAEAQAALTAAEAEMAAHMKAEQEMVNRIQALDAQEAQMEKGKREAHARLVDALSTGNGDANPQDMAGADAKLAAIRDARTRFPAQIQEHRARGDRITGRVANARAALNNARFEAALAAYRAAMVDVWRLADEVWQLGAITGRNSMPGMADPESKYGRLPG